MIYEDFFRDEDAQKLYTDLKSFRKNGLKVAFMSDIR